MAVKQIIFDNFTKASPGTDDPIPASEYVYRLYRSEADNMDTVVNLLTNGELVETLVVENNESRYVTEKVDADSFTYLTEDTGLYYFQIAVISPVGGISVYDETQSVNIVEQGVASISVDPSSIEAAEGTTQQLTIEVEVTGGVDDSYTVSSSDESVATVDASDLVSLVDSGSATITVRSVYDPEVTETVDVVVTDVPEVTGITVTPETIDDDTGTTHPLTIEVQTEGGADDSYTVASDDEAVATVENDVVTLVGEGTATITVTSVFDDNFTDTVSVTATEVEAVTGITVDPTSIDGIEGTTEQLTITVNTTGGADDSYTVSVDDENVATVDGSDLVSLVAPGSAVITIQSVFDNSFTETVAVEVSETPAVTGITIDPSSVDGEEGTTQQLDITVQTVGGADDSYTTSVDDESVATIDGNDLVSLHDAGSAVITVTSVFDGSTETVNVTVTEPDEVTGIDVTPSSINDIEGETVQLSITVNTTGAATSDYTTSVDDTNIATIDGSDLVTLVAAGSAVITITSVYDNSVTETVAVTVSEEDSIEIADPSLSVENLTITGGDLVWQKATGPNAANFIYTVYTGDGSDLDDVATIESQSEGASDTDVGTLPFTGSEGEFVEYNVLLEDPANGQKEIYTAGSVLIPEQEVSDIEIYDQDPDNAEIEPDPIASFGSSGSMDLSSEETIRIYAKVSAFEGADDTVSFSSSDDSKVTVTAIDDYKAKIEHVSSQPGDTVTITIASDFDDSIEARIDLNLYEDAPVSNTESEPFVFET